MNAALRFTVAYAALTAAHEVADYWVQRDADAVAKGHPGPEGAAACARHVASYTAVQAATLTALSARLGIRYDWRHAAAGLAVSALTHYAADRSAGRWNTTGPHAPAVARLAHRAGKGTWLTRDAEATAFTTGAPIWPRLRRWNDMTHVWDRYPDGPRHR